MKLEKDVVLKPLVSGRSLHNGREYFDQVMVSFGEYPGCILHVDNFFERDNPVYQALLQGRELRLKMMLVSWDEYPRLDLNNITSDKYDDTDGGDE
jgi:hypothetical protein